MLWSQGSHRDEGKDLIVGIELLAFADESGTQENPRYCLVAGWIGSPRQWRLFDRTWSQVLSEYAVPDFHSSDFFARKSNPSNSNPYRGWDDGRALSFLTALTSAISERRLHPIGGAVDVRVFMAYSEGERRYLTSAAVRPSGKFSGITGAPSRPYQLAFPIFLTEATQAAKEDASIHFVFDQNHNEVAYALQVFQRMKEEQRHELWKRLGKLTFTSRTQELGLQAADLYTHLWYAFLENGVPRMGVERYQAWQPLKKRRDWMRLADERFFEASLATLTPEQRSKLKTDMS